MLDVVEETVSIEDPLRARTYRGVVWRPREASGALPLVVYSHPSGGSARSAAYLARHLAGHGYVVGALDHAETFAPELQRAADEDAVRRDARAAGWIANRVPDLRLLVDALLAGAAGVVVDPARVGAAGHSFGGWTAIAAADEDPRLRAVVALAPAGGEPTSPGTIPVTVRFARREGVALLIVAGEDDMSIPIEIVRELYTRAPEPKRLVVVPGADHLHFMEDGERIHEAFRTSPGPHSAIAARMRPFGEMTPIAEVQRIVYALTLQHVSTYLM